MLQEALVSNDLSGIVGVVQQFLIPGDYDYTTASGTVLVETGDRVRLGASYAGPCPVAIACGDGGAVYEYLAGDATIDLGAVDYTVMAAWKKLVGGADDLENLYPGIGNFTDSDARAVGILVVMNDLRSSVEASLRNVALTAASLTVSAIENALLKADAELNVTASGGSFYGSGTVLAVGGQIVTNLVLGEAHAYVVDSVVVTDTGDVTVLAENISGVDARILAATTSGDTAVGITLAFNTIGWKSQNFLFNTVDAILGDPLISNALGGQQPAEAFAYVVNSDVTSAGGLTVTADNAAQLNATVSTPRPRRRPRCSAPMARASAC